jgi:hypothetical protein
MYRTEPPEAEVLRLREELEATKKDMDSVQRDRDKFKRRLWVLSTVILGAIPPALVLRYHAPSRILLLDVLGFAIWGWLILRVVRRRS